MVIKRMVILFISIWLSGFVEAQSDIGLPIFSSFEPEKYDIRNCVPLSIDKNGNIFLEKKPIKLDSLELELFKVLLRKSLDESLRIGGVILELFVDKNLKFKKLSPVLVELRKMDLLQVHFTCNAEASTQINGQKTSSYPYRLKTIKGSYFLQSEINDSLTVEILRRRKTDGFIQGYHGYYPPAYTPIPPPYRDKRTVSKLKSGELNMQVKVIHLGKKVFRVDNQKFSAQELAIKIKEWSSIQNTAYLLKPTGNCTYKNLLSPIVALRKSLKTTREEESLLSYNKKFEQLYWESQINVRNKFPFVMLIDY